MTYVTSKYKLMYTTNAEVAKALEKTSKKYRRGNSDLSEPQKKRMKDIGDVATAVQNLLKKRQEGVLPTLNDIVDEARKLGVEKSPLTIVSYINTLQIEIGMFCYGRR